MVKRSVGVEVVIRSFMVKVTLVEEVVDRYVAKSGSREWSDRQVPGSSGMTGMLCAKVRGAPRWDALRHGRLMNAGWRWHYKSALRLSENSPGNLWRLGRDFGDIDTKITVRVGAVQFR
jgi:hypothetical protein